MERLNSKLHQLAACLAVIAYAASGCSKAPPCRAPSSDISESSPAAYTKVSLHTAGEAPESMAAWIRTPLETFFGCGASGEVEISCTADYRASVFLAINIPGCSASILPEDLIADISQVRLPDIPATGVINGYMLERGPQTISIRAVRKLAKIEFGEVENLLEEAPYAGSRIILDSLFVINGKGRFKVFDYDDLSGIGNWFMPSGARGQALGQMDLPAISEADLGGIPLDWGKKVNLGKTIYTGPNNTLYDRYSREAGQGWAPRMTRAVLACRIGGRRCYYPITIEEITENTCYRIKKLTLKNFGVTAPDLPFSFDSEAIGFELADWDEVHVGEII